MKKGIVIIPAHRRPEFLAVCLEHIQRATGWDNYLYLLALDRGFDPDCERVWRGFHVDGWIYAAPEHLYPGNSYNVLHALQFACNQSKAGDIIHLIEEDVFVAPDYFTFHEQAWRAEPGAFFVSACRNQNLAQAPDGAPCEYFLHVSYQSLGVSFRRTAVQAFDALNAVLPHIVTDYFADMVGYIARHLFDPAIPAGNAEQDGLIHRVLRRHAGFGLYPYVPRAYHAGFTGYHRPAEVPYDGLSLEARIAALSAMTPEQMNQAARKHADITPCPMREHGCIHLREKELRP